MLSAAPDWYLLGYAGTKAGAEEIKRTIKSWLSENLKLNLSDEKTLITHAATQAARFLGYEIATQMIQDKLDVHGRRATNGKLSLRVPADVVEAKCARYIQNGVSMDRPELMADSDLSIVALYQQEYRGIVQYYLPAPNVHWFQKLRWVMETSLLKTLASKHKSTVSKMRRKYQATTMTPEGETLKCLEVQVKREGKAPLIARFGGFRSDDNRSQLINVN